MESIDFACKRSNIKKCSSNNIAILQTEFCVSRREIMMKKRLLIIVGSIFIIFAIATFPFPLHGHGYKQYHASQLEGFPITIGETLCDITNGTDRTIDQSLAKSIETLLSGMSDIQQVNPLDDEYNYKNNISIRHNELVFYPTFFVNNGNSYCCQDYVKIYNTLCDNALQWANID